MGRSTQFITPQQSKALVAKEDAKRVSIDWHHSSDCFVHLRSRVFFGPASRFGYEGALSITLVNGHDWFD